MQVLNVWILFKYTRSNGWEDIIKQTGLDDDVDEMDQPVHGGAGGPLGPPGLAVIDGVC